MICTALVLQFTVVCIVARSHPENSAVSLYVFLAAVGLEIVLGIGVQTFVPRFASKLRRKPNSSGYIINFAYSFGNRAQRCLTYHFAGRVEAEEPQADCNAMPEVCDSVHPLQDPSSISHEKEGKAEQIAVYNEQ